MTVISMTKNIEKLRI